MQNKILITGISGLIGSKLALKFHAQGYQVYGIKRVGTFVSDEIASFHIFEGDICDECFLDECLEGIDVVIHTAALVSFDRRDKAELFRINTEGTKNIVNSCLKKSVSKLIYISSVAALGRPKSDVLITEEIQWEESEYNTNYGYSKYLAELEFWRGMEEGLTGFCVNPSIIIGCGDIEKSSSTLFKNRFRKTIPYVEGSVNIIDERDVVQIIFELFEKNVNHEKYILNGHKVSVKELLERITKGTKAKLMHASIAMAKIAWVIDGVFSFLRKKRPQVTLETVKVLKAESDYSNEKIIKELEFDFHTLNQTFDHCNNFYVDK